MEQQDSSASRGPLRPTGILFALAANMLLVSSAFLAAGALGLERTWLNVLVLAAASAAGLVSAAYVGRRSGLHAFLGGLASAPFLTLLILNGNWRYGVLAWCFCALGGIFGEMIQRRRD